MPIKKATAFTASDGTMHATVEGAQICDLRDFLNGVDGTAAVEDKWLDAIAQDMIANRDLILEILTTGPRSKPSARKQKGTTNPRRATRAATPEQAAAGFDTMRAAANLTREVAATVGAD